MNIIELSVSDEKLETVMMIIKNLKNGLISEINVNNQPPKVKHNRYEPKINKIIYEDESGTNDKNGKYMSVQAYKKRVSK